MSTKTANGADADLHLDSLVSDVRDALVKMLQTMNVGWPLLSAKDQRQKFDEAEQHARELLRRLVDYLDDQEFPLIEVELGPVKFDKRLEIKVSAEIGSDAVLQLARHRGRNATLLFTDLRQFDEERRPPDVAGDQASMFGEEKRAP